MIPVYEDEQIVDKHVERTHGYCHVEPGDRYRKSLNLLLNILKRLMGAEDDHDREENEDRNVHKLGNHSSMFRSENSKEVLHCKVAFPFCGNTRTEENDPNIDVSENLLCPAQALEPGGITEDHIGKARHDDGAEENHNEDIPDPVEYQINYPPNTHPFILSKTGLCPSIQGNVTSLFSLDDDISNNLK
jgi:hypothetical protein